MSTKELLTKLGLSDQEAHVYLALLELGPSLISRIAKHTGMHRPTIYHILPLLEAKELVSVAPKGKQKLYIAETPEKLSLIFELLREQFMRALPELQQTFHTQKRRPLIKFFDGKNALAFTAQDILTTLKRGDIYYRYTTKRASMAARKHLPKDFYFTRDAKQLQHFMITDELTDWQKQSNMNRAVKILPRKFNFIGDNITQVIYGNKVAVGDFESETAFIIESPLFAELQRKIFKALYELL